MITTTKAEEKATALRVDGRGLYKIPLEQWVELFGARGRVIFNHLNESIYGHVCFVLSIIIASSFTKVNYN